MPIEDWRWLADAVVARSRPAGRLWFGRVRIDAGPQPRLTFGESVGRRPRLTNGDDVVREVQRVARGFCRRSGPEATRVVVHLYVQMDGRPERFRLAQGSGNEAFDTVALRAAQVARFTPAVVDHRPVAVWVELPMRVELQACPPEG